MSFRVVNVDAVDLVVVRAVVSAVGLNRVLVGDHLPELEKEKRYMLR